MCLVLKDVSKSYGKTIVFSDLYLDFSKRGMYLLVGKSGSGKTTLLNILAGYESIDEGYRDIDKNIEIACIFQSYELIPELTVKENICMSSELFDEDSHKNIRILDMLGIRGIENHYPEELSQGQKQRVGIARALWSHPNVILCDEPTESLDIENKEIVLELLKEVSENCIVIVASHDTLLMEKYYDYCYSIENQKVILKDKKKDYSIIDIEDKKGKKVNIKIVKKYIHKIIYKRTRMQTLILAVLMFFQIFTFVIDIQLFTKELTREVLNGNSLYIKLYGASKEELQRYGKVSPILSFLPLEIHGKSYKINVYPKQETKKLPGVKELKNNEMLINQNLYTILKQQEDKDEEEILQKDLELSYIIDGVSYTQTFKIVGVVEEDTNSIQAYYCEEGMNTILKSKPGNDVYLTQYDYIQNQAETYTLLCVDDTVEKTFKTLQENKQMLVYHSVLTENMQNSGQSQLYHLLFIVMQICLFICTLGYIIYYTIKDTTKNIFALSLFHISGVSLHMVKRNFFIEKCKYLGFPILGYSISILLVFILQMKYRYVLIITGYTIFIVVFYLFVLVMKLHTFTKQKISFILKEDKDI